MNPNPSKYTPEFLAKRFGVSKAQIKAQYLLVSASMFAEAERAERNGKTKVRNYTIAKYRELAKKQQALGDAIE